MPPASSNWLSTLCFAFPDDAFNDAGSIQDQQQFFSQALGGNGANMLYSLFTNESSPSTGSFLNQNYNTYTGPNLVNTTWAQNQWNTANPGEFNDFPFDTSGDYMSAQDIQDYGGDLGLGAEYTGMEYQDQANYDFWGSVNEQLKLFTPSNLAQTTYGHYDSFRDFKRGQVLPSLLRKMKHGVNLGGGGRQSNLKTGREQVYNNRLLDKYSDHMNQAENDISNNVSNWRDLLGNAWNTLMAQGEYLQNTYNPDEDF